MDIKATQQLRVEFEQFMIAYEPKPIQSWDVKQPCLSCQALGIMRKRYIPTKIMQKSMSSPVKVRKALTDPKYSGNICVQVSAQQKKSLFANIVSNNNPNSNPILANATIGNELIKDYKSLNFSLRCHPMALLRRVLNTKY